MADVAAKRILPFKLMTTGEKIHRGQEGPRDGPPPEDPEDHREASVSSTLGCVVSCPARLNGSEQKDIYPVKTVVLFSEDNNPPCPPSLCLTTGPLPLHRGAH